jgi:hypothetical protein
MPQSAKGSGVAAALLLVVVALAATFAPLPATAVERYYSQGLYPIIQRVVTPASNLVPVGVADIVVALLLAILAVQFVRTARTSGWTRASGRSALTVVKLAAIGQLVFLFVWGLHYRRVPLEEKLDFDQSRVTEARAIALATESVRQLNALHAAAHATPFDMGRVATAFADAERAMGMPGTTRIGVPKRSLLQLYVEKAAFSAVAEPVFLEIALHPRLLPIQKPRVLAHEWAHLAGYANEGEASFLAWLTCLRGDALAQYSGWLSAYGDARAELPGPVLRTLPRLDRGPREDFLAIGAVYRGSSKAIRTAARRTYDSYLKANRVSEGIASYDTVLELMLGTTLGREWRK